MKGIIYECWQRGETMDKRMGESGYGLYAIVPPNTGMRRYYMSRGESLIKFKIMGDVIDLTKESLRVLRYIRHNLAEMDKNIPGYSKPRVNPQNYHQFPHAITEYMARNHPKAAGYIVPHKCQGSNLPAGKQLVVTDTNAIDIVEIVKQKREPIMSNLEQQEDIYITYKEAAEYFRVTKQTFYLWVRQGKLPPEDKEGGLWKKNTLMKFGNLRPNYAKDDPRLISRDELCTAMGIATSTLQKRVAKKQMPAAVIRGFWLRKDVESYIRTGSNTGPFDDGTIGAIELAKKLGITSNYVYKLVKKKLLPQQVSPGRWNEADIPGAINIARPQ